MPRLKVCPAKRLNSGSRSHQKGERGGGWGNEMRCPDCNKFAAYDDSTEPEVDIDLNDDGAFSGQVRIVLTHDECGTELKEAMFDVEGKIPEEIVKEHSGDDHSLGVETGDAELTSRSEGSGRYTKTFYGYAATVDAVCSCGTDGLWSQGFSDDVQASHMDELV